MRLHAALLILCTGIAQPAEQNTPQAAETLARINARLQLEPGNPRLLAARGVALAGLGRNDESLQSFDRALAISPKFLLALEGAAETAYRAHDTRATNYLERVLAQDPTNETAHSMAAALAFEKRDCLNAVRHFEQGGPALASNAAAMTQWGECLLATEQTAPAAKRLRTALLLNERDQIVRYDLVFALHQLHQNEEALHVAQELKPDADGLILRASIESASGKLEEAIADYRKATELDPKNERGYTDLASLCLDHESFDVARDVVNAGLANLPESAALYTLRGAIESQVAKYDEAQADFERASRLQPDLGFGDVGLSMLLRDRNDIDRAIRLMRARLTREPDNADMQFLLADLLTREDGEARSASTVEARKLLAQVVQRKPEMAKAHSLNGKLLMQDGETKGAIAELRAALALDPDDRIALQQLALALRKAGQTGEAAKIAQHLRDVVTADQRTEVKQRRVKMVKLSPPAP